MTWSKVAGSNRSAILESSDGKYEILPNQRFSHNSIKGYLLYDTEKCALLNAKKEVVIGLGLFNAQGAPCCCVFETIKQIKNIVGEIG